MPTAAASVAGSAGARISGDLFGNNALLHCREDRLALVQGETEIAELLKTRRPVERCQILLADGSSVDHTLKFHDPHWRHLAEQHFLNRDSGLPYTPHYPYALLTYPPKSSPNFPARSNIAYTDEALFVRLSAAGPGHPLEAVQGQFGLLPDFATTRSEGPRYANVRAETIDQKRPFAPSWKAGQRCLIPVDGYIEFTGEKGAKQAHRFILNDDAPVVQASAFALAGLHNTWRASDGELVESFTVVTCEPNEFAVRYHDRMPVVLDAGDYEQWLRGSHEEAKALLTACPVERLRAYKPQPAINSSKNKQLDLIEPLEGDVSDTPSD